MPLFNLNEVYSRAEIVIETEIRESDKDRRLRFSDGIRSEIILEALKNIPVKEKYDIFLSHSSKDARLILGIRKMLEDYKYSVYVDWIDDPQLDRTNVNAQTADTLRKRMKSSRSLFYVTTENAKNSKWMPWECGYFDGYKEKVAILPVEEVKSYSNKYNGPEYLGLYPYCAKDKFTHPTDVNIHKDFFRYFAFETWVTTPDSQLTW